MISTFFHYENESQRPIICPHHIIILWYNVHSDQWMFLQNLYLITRIKNPKTNRGSELQWKHLCSGGPVVSEGEGWLAIPHIYLIRESHYHIGQPLTLTYTLDWIWVQIQRAERTLFIQSMYNLLGHWWIEARSFGSLLGFTPYLMWIYSFCFYYAKE